MACFFELPRLGVLRNPLFIHRHHNDHSKGITSFPLRLVFVWETPRDQVFKHIPKPQNPQSCQAGFSVLKQIYGFTFLQNVPFMSNLTFGQLTISSFFVGMIVILAVLSNQVRLRILEDMAISQGPTFLSWVEINGIKTGWKADKKNSLVESIETAGNPDDFQDKPIAQMAILNFGLPDGVEVNVHVEGPYGGLGWHGLDEFKDVIICAGGSGISFLLATFEIGVRRPSNQAYLEVAQYFGNLLQSDIEESSRYDLALDVRFFVTDRVDHPVPWEKLSYDGNVRN
ncbi:hypothetical protein H4Q26_000724 [Puccinia striiformis f. sp. tritici PST-130]|nr:hypothetical protein H4Q26_000724 [Puccinia striiformis f. sp. tritici PST-130]